MKIFQWTIKDERTWLVLWCGGIAVVVSFIIFIFPFMGDMMKSLLDKEAMIKAFMGRYATEMMQHSWLDMWLCLEFFGWIGVLMGAYPVIFAANAVSASIERHTMEMVLAQPVTRTRFLLEKYAALVVNLVVLCVVGYIALSLSAWLFVDEEASHREYVFAFINTFILLCCIGGFGFFCAVLINDQRTALSVTIGAVVTSFIVYKVLSAANVAFWVTYLTPYRYADATKIMAYDQFNLSDNIVLIMVGTTFLLGAIKIFNRKDIAV